MDVGLGGILGGVFNVVVVVAAEYEELKVHERVETRLM